MTITSLNIAEGTIKKRWRPRCRPLHLVMLLFGILVIAIIIAYFLGAFEKTTPKTTVLVPPNPQKPLPPSSSKLHRFQKAAVCADAPVCAEIGKNILERNGSAVDAAIATLFCNGVVNMQSMGLGGGFLMTVYIRDTKTAVTLDARETAPLNATANMFKNENESKYSGLAVGVPGELRGYWVAHEKYGTLPWKELVQPTVDLCERGYNMSVPQFDVLYKIRNDSNLREWFFDANGKFKPAGSLIKPKKLCDTLKIIADSDGNELYNGTLSKMLLQDIKDMGGIITEEDLQNYTPKWRDPVSVDLNGGDHLYSVPPPGSGILLAFILNILDGYNFTRDSISNINKTVLTYQRIIEAFKFAYARRTELGDTDFVNITTLLQNLTSNDYARDIRDKILDNTTHLNPADYGAVFYNREDHGTAHISVLAQNGDAVSVTSTVNVFFGNGVTSESTGIILNNGMDDFSSPNFPNYFDLPGSPNNAIAPGKRSLSSMTPTIITDQNGDVRMVIGASGGTKITTSIALVIMRNLWFGDNIKEAVDAPRIHHQLYPMEISYEYGTLQVQFVPRELECDSFVIGV
ncbi:hypothetical protein RI129_010353 [Pyrocoelia pectoralis]|uniref:Uncharacterized protein n=1 Tax=Pyrocoelia pectoralis TaxID=417401 RepID=A0AAN7VB48_9COLE